MQAGQAPLVVDSSELELCLRLLEPRWQRNPPLNPGSCTTLRDLYKSLDSSKKKTAHGTRPHDPGRPESKPLWTAPGRPLGGSWGPLGALWAAPWALHKTLAKNLFYTVFRAPGGPWRPVESLGALLAALGWGWPGRLLEGPRRPGRASPGRRKPPRPAQVTSGQVKKSSKSPDID